MINKEKVFLIFFSIIFLLFYSMAYSQIFSFKSYNNADGLIQTQVFSIFQDSKGYLWFGTRSGISRYNGSEFFNLSKSDGLVGDFVLDFLEDKNNNIWIATYEGLCYLQGKNIVHFNLKTFFDSQIINTVFSDKEGNIWVGTSEGLAIIDPDTQEIIKVEKGILKEGVTSIFQTSNGKLFIASSHRLFRTEGLALNLEEILSLDYQIRVIIADEQERIFLATNHGLIEFSDGSVKLITEKEGLPSNDVHTIMIDSRGRLWVGTPNGLAKIDKTGIFTFTKENGLPNLIIHSLFEDREKNIWIGTDYGVAKLPSERFRIFSSENGLKADIVWSIYQDSRKRLWVGTQQGLYLFNKNENRFGKFTLHPILKKQSIRSIIEDDKNRIWFGTRNNGLFVYNDRTFQHFDQKDGYLINNLLGSFRDSRGRIWFGGMNGLSIYQNGKFKHYDEIEGTKNLVVSVIYEDLEGKIWIGTMNGLFLFKNNHFLRPEISPYIGRENVRSIFQDSRGNFWVGTAGKGLFKFNGKKMINLTTKNGLAHNSIWGIIEDEKGNMWFGTNKGLNKFDGRAFKNYNSKSELKGDELALNCLFKDEAGNLWFGIYPGITQYIPAEDEENLVPPLVYIEKLCIFNEDFEPFNLKLKYSLNDIIFHFIGLSFKNENLVRYSYYLEGYDQTWSPETLLNQVRYTNLSPEKYTFWVKAKNNDGVWSKEAASVSFTIYPPFWKTYWFLGIVIGTGIIILMTVYNIKTSSIRRRKEELENQVAQRTKELEEKIEQINRLKEKAEKLAITDSLTQLFNRRHFLNIVEKELARAKRYNQKMILLILDVDYFKKINDVYGHQAGDFVLIKIANILKSSIRASDTVARFGGDEFIILLVNSKVELCLAIAERIRKKIEKTKILFGDLSLDVTVSIGASFYPLANVPDVSYEHLIQVADEALYQAKRKGRNKLTIHPLCKK
ncbi:MAG: two-component regulator propeller domain-containing protein [Candidatus Aminicenantia bacterium]